MKGAQPRSILAIAVLAVVMGTGPVAAAEPEENERSAKELNKQLSNPVTNLWSLTFQFNNYILENDHWNNNACPAGAADQPHPGLEPDQPAGDSPLQ